MSIIFRVLTIFVLFNCVSSLTAQYVIPDEKLVDYSVEDMPLRDVLVELSEKTDVTIAFQEEILPGDSLVSFSVRNEKLGKVIDFLILSHGLKYKIVGNQIVISKDPYNNSSDKITISGYLKDGESGEPLIGAAVYLNDQSKWTTSNEYGFYSFTIDKGKQRVYYDYLGYNRGMQEFSLARDTVINIELESFNLLNEIVITENRIVPSIDFPEISPVNILPIDRITSSLPMGGEPDIMRLSYSLPGVTTGADGFGGMSVRGGATNQNLILYDGIPVYNANHAFGLFSIFNSNVIKSAKLYKGAFPSHYSGRLSSVLDVRTRDGNNKALHGDFSIGLLTIKGSVEGPIQKDKSSFLISIRRTFVDPWIGSLTKYLNEREGKNGSSDLYFFDFNGKLNFSLGEKSKLLLSYYSGLDNFNNETTEIYDNNTRESLDQTFWNSGNTLASLRWNFKLSHKTFLNLSAYYSKYVFNSFDHDRVGKLEGGIEVDNFYEAGYYQSEIRDRGLKFDFDFIPSPKHNIKFGTGYIRHEFTPGLILADHFDNITTGQERITKSHLQTILNAESLYGNEFELYIEDNIRLGKRTYLNLGFNQLIVSTGKTYYIPQPRFLFSTGSENYTFKISWGQMGQYLHSLTNSGLGIPVDVWLPSTENIEPEKSWILSVGQFYHTKKMGVFGIELYYKDLSKLTRYGDTGLLNINKDANWENLVPIGDGESYGLELSLDKSLGKTSFNAAYTLSWSNRTFPGINNGEKFRYRHDRRHVTNLGIIHKLNDNFEVSANWEYGSGSPVTIDNGQNYFYIDENGQQTLVLIFEEINNDELPAYHRMDFGVNIYNKYKWGRSKLTIGVYNLYNRRNPFYRDVIVTDEVNPNTIKYQELTILPILPTFSYNVSF